LIDILPENADPSLPVKPGQFVSIPYRGSTRKGEILVASNLHVHYYVHSVQNAKLQIPTAEFRSRWGADIFEYSERSLREEYLGATPGKATATGKIVMARYQYRTVTGVLEVEWQSGTWHPLLDCDMSHYPVDAVDEWNSRLKHTGIRSSAVRAWMNDPRNYILEPAARNRSRSSKSRYEPPTV
jgi:hypothetical protein